MILNREAQQLSLPGLLISWGDRGFVRLYFRRWAGPGISWRHATRTEPMFSERYGYAPRRRFGSWLVRTFGSNGVG